MDERNPTEVTDNPWVWVSGQSPFKGEKVLGKWLVFENVSTVNETWAQIRDAISSGAVASAGAKVSTAFPSPFAKNSQQKVICVYTSAERMDEVGLQLIALDRVRRTIRYKTDEATAQGLYANQGDNKKVSCRTLYWNNEQPQFET